MTSKILNEIRLLNPEQLEKEIIVTKNKLFELRFKKATRQSFKSHSFMELKYKLRLLFMCQNKTILQKKRRRMRLNKNKKIIK